jgi:hypothetical protein
MTGRTLGYCVGNDVSETVNRFPGMGRRGGGFGRGFGRGRAGRGRAWRSGQVAAARPDLTTDRATLTRMIAVCQSQLDYFRDQVAKLDSQSPRD